MSGSITWKEVRALLCNVQPDYIKASKLDIEEINLATQYLEKYIPNGPGNYIPTRTVHGVVDRQSSIIAGLQYIKTLACFLRRLEKFGPGFNKFNKRFRSHYGFQNQLHATIYLDKFMEVINIEKDGSRDADVTAMVGSWRTHFHIKTFDQRAKMSNLVLIDKQITEHLKQFPIYNTQHQRLCLGDITGVHSSGILSAEELDLVIAKLPDQLSQSVIYPNKNSSTPDKVDLKFGWNVGGGKIGGLDQFWSWPEAVESVEKHVQKDDNVKHILVGVTPEVCGLVLSQKYLDALKISGVFFLETPCLPSGGLRFNRSDIFLKQSDQKYLEALLSLPLTIDITPDLNS